MRIDYNKIDTTRVNAIQSFNDYVNENNYPSEDRLFELTTMQLVGYFLQVHSKDPEYAIRQYLRVHAISYRKSTEVRMLVKILK